jgi:hypothetical protein
MRTQALVLIVAAVCGMAMMATAQTQKDKDPVTEWTGTLHLGIVAVGGETTGIVLETPKGTFELKAANDGIAAAFKKLDKQKVVVTGTLHRQPGVEVKERVIVTVTKVTKA